MFPKEPGYLREHRVTDVVTVCIINSLEIVRVNFPVLGAFSLIVRS